MLRALAAFIQRHPRWILIAAGVLTCASLWVVARGGHLTGGAIEGLEAGRAEQHVERVLGGSTDTTAIAVFSFADFPGDHAAALRAIDRALEPLRHDPRVRSVLSPAAEASPLGPRTSDERRRMAYAVIVLAGDFKEALAAYPDVRRTVADAGIDVAFTGRVAFQHDLDHMLRRDLVRAEAIALPIALLVLLLVFRTAVAAVLPVVVGGLAVLGGIAIVMLLSRMIDVASYTINVASLIGLGVAIDYSLFMVSRYREELDRGSDYRAALERTLETAGHVIAVSGLAVATGLFGLVFFRGSYLTSMGLGGAIVVALAVMFGLTVLPALLVVLGPKIHAGKLPRLRLRRAKGRWQRGLDWVLARPGPVLVVTASLLLLLGLPFAHLRMAGVDTNVLPATAEARRGQALLEQAFPDQARTRIVVAVEFPTAPALTSERIGALYDLSRRIAAIPGVAKVESLVDAPIPVDRATYQRILLAPPAPYAAQIEAGKAMTVGEREVLLYALTDAPAESDAAREIVRQIRTERAVADGTIVVGGQAALDADSTAFIVARTPYAVVFVVCVTLVVLYLTFRSVVIPIKAVLANFMSIAGAFGALVWVFQDGHLFVDDPRPIDPSVPVLLFCILFGLSMDYHVLMLSRIREAHDQLRDNTRAIKVGLAHSANLITAAAAIMVAVFGAFALARFVVIRSVGFGMALAVTLDATVVRLLLVPSSMQLLGEWNWWSPHPLARLRRWRHARAAYHAG